MMIEPIYRQQYQLDQHMQQDLPTHSQSIQHWI